MKRKWNEQNWDQRNNSMMSNTMEGSELIVNQTYGIRKEKAHRFKKVWSYVSSGSYKYLSYAEACVIQRQGASSVKRLVNKEAEAESLVEAQWRERKEVIQHVCYYLCLFFGTWQDQVTSGDWPKLFVHLYCLFDVYVKLWPNLELLCEPQDLPAQTHGTPRCRTCFYHPHKCLG